MKQFMVDYKILFLALLLPCCLSCGPLTRNELEYSDTRLMIHIFGKALAKEMKLKRVHYRTNWDRYPSKVVYAIEMTSGTLSKVVSAGLAKKLPPDKLSEDDMDDMWFTFYNLGAYDQAQYDEKQRIKGKLNMNIIELYYGHGWSLYWDRSRKPSVAFFHTTDSDLISWL